MVEFILFILLCAAFYYAPFIMIAITAVTVGMVLIIWLVCDFIKWLPDYPDHLKKPHERKVKSPN